MRRGRSDVRKFRRKLHEQSDKGFVAVDTRLRIDVRFHNPPVAVQGSLEPLCPKTISNVGRPSPPDVC